MRTKLSHITIRRAESNENFEQLYQFRLDKELSNPHFSATAI